MWTATARPALPSSTSLHFSYDGLVLLCHVSTGERELKRLLLRRGISRVTKINLVNSVDFRKQHEPGLEECHDDGELTPFTDVFGRVQKSYLENLAYSKIFWIMKKIVGNSARMLKRIFFKVG